MLLASFALVTAPLAIVVAIDHPPLLEAEPVTSPVRDIVLFAENSVAVAAVVAVDAFPVKLPSTLPFKLPLIVLVNLFIKTLILENYLLLYHSSRSLS